MGKWRTSVTMAIVSSSAALLVMLQIFAPIAVAREFDVTGTLDCGSVSGRQCDFVDWEHGPTLALFTEDISGTLERIEIDASWIKDHLTAFGQDDFVWFTVQDADQVLRGTGVVEHRCRDGRVALGWVNQGRADGTRCH